MKSFYTWFLVIITSFHWIGGYLCFKINYPIEVERVMNTVEKKIADAIREEMGVDIHVEIIHEDLPDVESFGYSGDFIFSKEIDGKTHYYKINSNPIDIVNHKFIAFQHGDTEDGTNKVIFFIRLFSKFTVQYFLPLIVRKLEDLPRRNFIYKGFYTIFQPSIPPPPPK